MCYNATTKITLYLIKEDKMNAKNEETKLAIYEYINDYIKTYRASPSIKEIAKAVNCALSTAHKFLVRLEEEGYIERGGRKHIVTNVNNWEMDCLPVIGMVACGKPKLAVEDIQFYLPINKKFFGMGEFFGLIANGNSMINAGIENGDIVIVRKQFVCEEGQIVVAMIQDEYSSDMNATLKRFYKTKNKSIFRLHPENDEMEDIYVNEINIIGIAVKVLKDLN